jgi:hypothetical protein
LCHGTDDSESWAHT